TNSKIEIVENLNFSKNDLYQITIENNIKIILSDLGIIDKDNNFLKTVPEYIVGANEEIRAYLRGVFSGTGSINDPKKSRYHLELLVTLPEEAVFVQKLLNLFDLNAKILNREKGYMIYIKEAEKISDFLKILRANKAVMYYEDVRVYRDQKNKTNRLNNCEQANMDKVIQTATTQLEQIRIIEENDGLMLLDDKTKETLKYRKKYPEASLKELSEIISLETNKPITKSGLSHRLRKIKELAENLEKITKEDA
ncbi:MAG: DNA-binding protein WhiA, partial [Bacilli bacterium]|nr:DNA-binding protein WhiA [Bacilli bacterium]